MEEFIFGTFATDELKLIHHRASHHGIHHLHAITPLDPLPNQSVKLTVQTGPDVEVSHVACYFTTDGTEPIGSFGHATHGDVIHFQKTDIVWDSLIWGYITYWEAELPPLPESTMVRYRISAWNTPTSPEYFAETPRVQPIAEQAANAFFRQLPIEPIFAAIPNQGQTFAYHVDTFTPPQWAKDAIIYQIFVDRFYHGDGQTWLQTDDLNAICGGTLWGIQQKLDYLTELGINCIWLTPIFVSDSHHGYDTTDYKQVEPRLGGNEALAAVVEGAHQRGIRILLDLACNHIADQHPIFQEALRNPHSAYRQWFTFDESTIGYQAFFGVPSMPQLNLAHPEAREWMLDIARFWLREFNIDGYRLDYANGPEPDFWVDFYNACKTEKPDSFCFGEIIDAPEVQKRHVGKLDGCLDFHLGDALRRTFGTQKWTEKELDRFLMHHRAYFPDDFILPSFLDNHDMDRFLFIAQNDIEAVKRAAAYQMQLPNPPIIYYGTEIGLQQTIGTREGMGLHQCRMPMVWGKDQNQDLLHFYQTLIRQRRS